jgi:ribosomal protein L37AE/L43A
MKYVRSSKCHYSKWLTVDKQSAIKELLAETHRVVSWAIDKHHLSIAHCGMEKKHLLLAHNLHECDSWLTERAKKNCFAEAFALVSGTKASADELKKEYTKPTHNPHRIMLSSTNATINLNPGLKGFDILVELNCFDSRVRARQIAIPLKRNDVFNGWFEKGKLATSVILNDRYIQFSFEVECEKKKTGNAVGFDPGAKILLTSDNGAKYGTDIWRLLEKLKRKKRCSHAWYACREEILEYIDKSCKEIPFEAIKYLVLEDNRKIKNKMKIRRKGKRLSKRNRSVLTGWAIGRIDHRCKLLSEENGVSFRRVPAWNNSRTCPDCGCCEEANRVSQEVFVCRKCGHIWHADIVGATNTLARFALGPYGAECKPEFMERHPGYYQLRATG